MYRLGFPDGYDDDNPTFWRLERRKARKEHGCKECREIIPRGAFHWHFAGRWGEELLAWDACLACEADWQELMDLFGKNRRWEIKIVYGLIAEAVQEALDSGYLERDDRLVRKWLDIPEEENPEKPRGVISQREAVLAMQAHSRRLL